MSSEAEGTHTHSLWAQRKAQRQWADAGGELEMKREVSVEEWEQDVGWLQSRNTSEKLLWFAPCRMCTRIKGPIKRSIKCLAAYVAHAMKAAIKVTSSHFTGAFSWIYSAWCLVFVIDLDINYFNIKGCWSVFCFCFMDKILISIESHG